MKGGHQFTPLGGLNSDDSIEIIPAEDYTYAENCEIGFTNEGKKGAIRTLRGHKEVDQNLVPIGSFVSIGKVQDNDSNQIIEFLYDENLTQTHTIQIIDRNDVAITICRGSFLGLNRNRINSANVIDGLLTWSQVGQSPKAFIIDKAIRFTNSQGQDPLGYELMDRDTILAGAIPPNFRPKARYITIPDVETNHVANDTYQFSYFFVYDDNTRSTPSPISRIAIPQLQWGPNGRIYQADDVYNAIEVSFSTGIHTVKNIVLLFRKGNIGQWNIFRTIRKKDEGIQNNTIGYAQFTGLEAGEIFSQTFRNFSYIPITADFQEYLNTNQIVYGNYEAGNDKPTPQIELTHERITPTTGSIPLEFFNSFSINENNAWLFFETVPSAGTILSISLKPALNQFGETVTQPEITFDDPQYSFEWIPDLTPFIFVYEVTEQDAVNGLNFFIEQFHIALVAAYQIYSDNYYSTLVPLAPIAPTLEDQGADSIMFAFEGYPGPDYADLILNKRAILFRGLQVEFDASDRFDLTNRIMYRQEFAADSVPVTTNKSFKQGSFVYCCLNYYDKFNRDNAGVTNRVEGTNGFRIYIPWTTEQSPANAADIYANVIKTKIFHRPPEFATHYQWAVAPSINIQSFGHFKVQSVDLNDNPTEQMAKLTLANYNLNQNRSINHTPTEGDICRVYALDTNVNYPFATQYREFQIEKVDGFDVFFKTFADDGSLTSESVIEIYTPRLSTEENNFYYEFGQEFSIIDPGTENRRHEGAITNQSADLVTPAETILDNGDVFVRLRNFPVSPTAASLYIEDSRFSDWFLLSENDRGRVVAYDPEAAREKYNVSIIHGGSYFNGTLINDLWVISSLSEERVGVNFGSITGLVMKGYTLEVYQKHKVNSVYIGRVMATNADGQTNQIGLSNQTFGSIEPSRYQWGCQDPSSITKTKTHTYFFDKSNGAWCRNASNGIFPISSYKYEQFWADRANELLALPEDSYSILSVFDDRHNILITEIYAETSEANAVKDMVIYSDSEKRWKVHTKLQYEDLGFVGNAVYGSIKGQSYRLWMGEDGIFSDQRLFPRIDFVVNTDFGIEKLFDQITIASNAPWDVTQLEIPEEFSSSGKLMLSRISDKNLERYESKYHAEIKGNILTPGISSPALAIIKGDDMRGRAMKVSMTCLEEKSILLSHALVKFTQSMQTP